MASCMTAIFMTSRIGNNTIMTSIELTKEIERNGMIYNII
jgi:hypothetical protein